MDDGSLSHLPISLLNATNVTFYYCAVRSTLSDVAGAAAACATICNLFFLASLFIDSKLRRVSSLFMGLLVGHVINDAAYCIHAFYVLQQSPIDAVELVPVTYCMKTFLTPTIVFSYQVIPVLLALVGLERLLALAAPNWFRSVWTTGRSLTLTLTAWLACLISVAARCAIVLIQSPLSNVPRLCLAQDVFGDKYMLYDVHTVAVIGGICAAGCTLAAIIIGWRASKKLPHASVSEKARMRRQQRLSQSMFAVACIDLVCVVGPNAALIVYYATTTQEPPDFLAATSFVYYLRSVFVMCACLVFSPEFRYAVIKLLKCCRVFVAEQTEITATAAARGQNRVY